MDNAVNSGKNAFQTIHDMLKENIVQPKMLIEACVNFADLLDFDIAVFTRK